MTDAWITGAIARYDLVASSMSRRPRERSAEVCTEIIRTLMPRDTSASARERPACLPRNHPHRQPTPLKPPVGRYSVRPHPVVGDVLATLARMRGVFVNG